MPTEPHLTTDLVTDFRNERNQSHNGSAGRRSAGGQRPVTTPAATTRLTRKRSHLLRWQSSRMAGRLLRSSGTGTTVLRPLPRTGSCAARPADCRISTRRRLLQSNSPTWRLSSLGSRRLPLLPIHRSRRTRTTPSSPISAMSTGYPSSTPMGWR